MDLATEIPPGDVEPEWYLKPSAQTFSLKIPTVGEVRNLLRKLNGRKAAGLDKIPCKLLKVASDIPYENLSAIYYFGHFPIGVETCKSDPRIQKG